MLSPKTYPAADFYAAWRNAILYDEHTWGAHNSISQPDSEFAKGAVGHQAGLRPGRRPRVAQAAGRRGQAGQPRRRPRSRALLVFNTSNWPRTDLVVLPKTAQAAGDAVLGPDGKPVPSQRLSTGQLAFLASDVPPLGARRFTLLGRPAGRPRARAKAAGRHALRRRARA